MPPTYSEVTEPIDVLPLTMEAESLGRTLHSGDEVTENGRGGGWAAVEILPGDTSLLTFR